MSQINETIKTIYDQLAVSKVNGFPFFNYTGIKKMVYDNEQNTLIFIEIPKNPNHISMIKIKYDYGYDLYNLEFYHIKKRLTTLKESINGIYNDQLADLIVDKMGVR